MAALDSDIAETQVKDGVDRETVETVPGDGRQRQVRLGSRVMRMDCTPQRALNENYRSSESSEKNGESNG